MGDERVGRKRDKTREDDGNTAEHLLASLSSLLKAVAVIVLVLWALWEHRFVKQWLSSVTHLEMFGTTLDRKNIDEATAALEKLAGELAKDPGSQFERSLGEAAIRRSVRVAPAIVNARILWVDDNKEKHRLNDLISDILTKLNIEVTHATSTEDAMRALRRSPFELIISDIWRGGDQSVPLERCRVHYFDYPSSELRKKYEMAGSGLERFNAESNRNGPAGFSMIEQLVADNGEMTPPVIFFSARNSGIVRSLCGDRITDRADVLLQAIVSALEEQRWRLLPVIE